jgi:hypothetical protein
VIRISEENLNAEFLEDILRHALHRRKRADRHENWGLDFAMGSDQASGAGGAVPGLDLKVEGHLLDCSNRRAEVRLPQVSDQRMTIQHSAMALPVRSTPI